jgi:hypothetical protein
VRVLFFSQDPFGRKLEYEMNIDFPEVANYFAVDKTTGEVTVKKRPSFELDRDKEPFGTYTIELVVRDNRPPTAGFTSKHFCQQNECVELISFSKVTAFRPAQILS